MAKKVIKQERDRQRKVYSSFSRRVGLLSGLTMFVTLVIDAISLFVDTRNISIAMGFIILIISLFIMSEKFNSFLDRVITRKDYLAKVIDVTTVSSVFTFTIEKLFMSAVECNLESRWNVLVIIVIFLALPIIVAIILFTKADAKYYVEE